MLNVVSQLEYKAIAKKPGKRYEPECYALSLEELRLAMAKWARKGYSVSYYVLEPAMYSNGREYVAMRKIA